MHYGFSWCLAGFCSQTCAQISQVFELTYDSDWVSGQVIVPNALDVLLNRSAKLNFVRFNKRRMHIYMTGEGTLTVVFESGMGASCLS